MPFVAVWFLLGAGAKLIGYAPTITGGMKFVGQKISEWWGVGQPSPAAWYPVDESQLAELTAALKPFFDILIFLLSIAITLNQYIAVLPSIIYLY